MGGHHLAGRPFAGRNLVHANRLANNSHVRTQFAHGLIAGGALNHVRAVNNGRIGHNAFGSQIAWRGWNARWHNRHGGWFGPVIWPFFYGDIWSFALWPYDYYNSFWDYDVGSIVGSIYWPGPPLATNTFYDVYGYKSFDNDGRARGPGVISRVNPDETAISKSGTVEACGGLAPGVTDLPMQRIERSIHPTGTQVTGLEHLKAASSQANDILKASCPSQIPLTPLGRLDAVQKRLAAMIQAVQVVRGPLYEFYNSLTDEQRRNFDALGAAKLQNGAKAPASVPAAQACGSLRPAGGEFSQLPVERIEETIRLARRRRGGSTAQVRRIQGRKRSSDIMPKPDAGNGRGSARRCRHAAPIALLLAVKTLHPALDEFYASLDDEQKAHFNTMGQPWSRSSRGGYDLRPSDASICDLSWDWPGLIPLRDLWACLRARRSNVYRRRLALAFLSVRGLLRFPVRTAAPPASRAFPGCARVLTSATCENACGKLPTMPPAADRIPPRAGRRRCAATAGVRIALCASS